MFAWKCKAVQKSSKDEYSLEDSDGRDLSGSLDQSLKTDWFKGDTGCSGQRIPQIFD